MGWANVVHAKSEGRSAAVSASAVNHPLDCVSARGEGRHELVEVGGVRDGRQSTYCRGVTAKSSGRLTPVAWFGQ
jgi:hypothetical protein